MANKVYKTKPTAQPGQVVIKVAGGWQIEGAATGKAPVTKSGSKKTTTTTLPNANPTFKPPSSLGISFEIPTNISTKYKIPAGTKIEYTAPSSSTTGATLDKTPTSGKALYNAIIQSLPKVAANALLKQWYGSSTFNPEGKDATKVLDRVFQSVNDTTKLTGNTNALINYDATGAYQTILSIPVAKAKKPTASAVTNAATVQGQANFHNQLVQQNNEFRVQQANSNRQAAASNAIAQEGITVGISQATANQESSAFGVVSNYLQTWGLQADSSIVHSMIMKSGDHVTDTDAILNAIRGNSVSGMGPAADAALKRNYDANFAGLEAYNRSPGAVHMTETQYQTYTQSITNVSTQYGAPMPNQKQIGELLNGHVSPVEYQQRVTDIYAQVSNADPAVKAQLAQEYGVNQKNLFAYFANPKNALETMQRQVAGAEINDYGNRVGLNGLNTGQQNQLADMAKLAGTAGNQGLGYGIGQIENSLLSASKDAALTHSAPGANANTVNNSQLIGSQLAGFDGTHQVAAETEVMRAEGAKAAPFEKGGGYAENQKGVVGLGSART
jgi:hypothetical protein